MADVLLLVHDLMFRTRIEDTLSQHGIHAQLAPDAPEKIGEDDAVLVIDLGGVPELEWDDFYRFAKAQGLAVVGFAPHKMEDKLARGRTQGFDAVVVNGQMAGRPQDIIAPLLERQRDHAAHRPEDGRKT